MSALLFLYREILRIDIGSIDQPSRARMPARLPVVLSRDEVAAVLKRLHDTLWIICMLLYGAGSDCRNALRCA